MKNLIFLLFLLISSTSFLEAQTCSNNPLVENGTIFPNPLKPGDVGNISFTFNDDTGDYAGWSNHPINIVICFLHIEPTNGVMALSGNGSGWFTWAYDQGSNCLLGAQNQTTFANSAGTIQVNFNQTSPQICDSGNNTMGFNVNLQPAACMNGINNSADDMTSDYTCINPTSVEQIYDQLQLEVVLFPNPATTSLNLEVTNSIGHQSVFFTITDTQGKMIKELGVKELFNGKQLLTYDIKDLVAGHYFLSVNNEEGKGGVVKFAVIR